MTNRYYSGPVSNHYDGVRFFNPVLPTSEKTTMDLLRWRFAGGKATWPKQIPAATGIIPSRACELLRVTHVGHASLLIQVSGVNILVDPVWSNRASPLSWIGPRRRNAPAIRLEDLPPIDVVLITHNHYDHCDVASIRAITQVHQPRVLTPLGNDVILKRAVPDIHVVAGDWWDGFEINPHLHVSIVPANHWSSRGLRDRRMALWGGFVLKTNDGTVYCVGDTGYGEGKIFRQIQERFGPPVVAVVPIGAYSPRWFMKSQHVDPTEAVCLGHDCGAKTLLGVHWNTFPLTDEPYDEPAQRFREAYLKQGHKLEALIAFRPGDIWNASDHAPI